MASIVSEDGIDLVKLHHHINKELPDYARPIFIRISHEMEVTGTFKHRKVDLVKEGIDLSVIKEPVYFSSPTERQFVPLTQDLHDQICTGQIKL